MLVENAARRAFNRCASSSHIVHPEEISQHLTLVSIAGQCAYISDDERQRIVDNVLLPRTYRDNQCMTVANRISPNDQDRIAFEF